MFPLITAFTSLQAQNFPFPVSTNNSYVYPTPGVIKPSNVTQSVMNSTIQTFYNQWKQQYLATVPYAPDQMYVFYNEDGESDPENAVAVSEGQGYGMILSAYMGDQANFDSLFRFCLAFPSSITPSFLVGWQQVDEDGTIDYFPDGGDHSATDGDMDVAYALLLADKQWGSSGNINYLAYANTMMSSILLKDVNLSKFSLKLGDWVTNNDQKFGKATRPSDFILNHLRCFAAASEDSRWLSLIDKTYSIINELYTNFSNNTGLLPDFVEFKNNAYVPAEGDFLEREADGDYSWNSCRTPWRIATDYILSGDMRALTQLTILNNWIRGAASNQAYNINAGYELNGTLLPDEEGEFYDDLAFTTPFGVSAMINTANQTWLNRIWSYTAEYPTSEGNYFSNSIRLLSWLVISGNWWTPINLP
jgi:endo-1,4-beta-D-glucanase Y